jgi:hypothetical protein
LCDYCARAQIVPVRLTHEALPDSKIPSRVVLLLPPRIEPRTLAKPLAGLPTPAYCAAGALFATGVNWLGWKMARSPRWHKIWWFRR